MYLLGEWEGRTGKYLARGHGVRTEPAQRGPYAMTKSQIFSGPARPNLVVNKQFIIWPSRFFFQSFVFHFFPWEGQRLFSFVRIFK